MGNSDIVNFDTTISVSGNTGTVTIPTGYPINGEIKLVSIKAPTEAATFTIVITDTDNFPIYKEASVTGSTPIPMFVYVNNRIVITLSSATNGTYSVRLFTKP